MKKRSYKQSCALARALDLVGERWTLLIIRELIIAPKRYKSLAENLKGMGTNLLATRLKELEHSNIIERVEIPASKLSAYQLTDFGRELESPVLAIIRWGFNLADNDEPEYLSVSEWDLVAMKAAFRAELAMDLRANVEFITEDLHFFVEVDNQSVDIRLDNDKSLDGTVEASFATLMQIDAEHLSFAQAKQRKSLQLHGDEGLIRQLLQCFKVSG